MSRSGGSTFERCGCRDQRTGRQLGQCCLHLRDRGHGSWYLAIELSAAPDGRRRRVRLGGYATRAAAEAAPGQLSTPGGQPRGGAAGCTTGQWLAAWLAGRQSLRPSARRSYQHHLDTYLIPRIGGIQLATLTAGDLRVMFTAMSRQRPATGAPLSAATLARVRATLRAALNAAIREGLITANPARLVELPPPARPHPVAWTLPRETAWRENGTRPAVAVRTAEQTARFLAAIRGEPLYPCYQLMAPGRRRRHPGQRFEALRSEEPVVTDQERDQLTLAPGAESYETPEWITRLAGERRAVGERLDERKGVRVPSQDPDYEDQGEAWPAWPGRDRDAILQPPKPQMQPAPAVAERAAQAYPEREAAG